MDTNLSSTLPTISALVITKNEEAMLANCLETLRWCDEIIVVDTHSTDRTRDIAEKLGAKVFLSQGTNFSEWRTQAAQSATSDWLLYVDADERVTPDLAKCIQSRVQRPDFDAYTLRRNNIHYGRWMQHGGWQHDALLRLMRKSALLSWQGDVHEHAEIRGRVGAIEEPLVHLTHRSVADGLRKSSDWTDREARLLLAANHPMVGPLRLVKIVLFDTLGRFLWKVAWKDGTEGSIEALIQSMNRFLVYVRLWELQQKPSIPDRYARIERAIQHQWSSLRKK